MSMRDEWKRAPGSFWCIKSSRVVEVVDTVGYQVMEMERRSS